MKKNKEVVAETSGDPQKPFLAFIVRKDTLALAIVSLYLLVDFIPQATSIDVNGPQWLSLAVLNLLVSSYILVDLKGKIAGVIGYFSGNALSRCYIAVFILSGISIFFAINRIESLVVYARFTVNIIAFLNISILIHNRLKSIIYICQAISVAVLIQCAPILISFLQEIGSIPLDSLILRLEGNAGNKNILAASLIIKLPFVIYCTLHFKSFLASLFNILSITLLVLLIFIMNARAAYIGLSVQLLIYSIFYFRYYLKNGSSIRILSGYFKVITPVVLALIISQALLSNLKTEDPTAQYGTVTERLSSVIDVNNASANARLSFWGNALNYIKIHPFTGAGYGNWKLASIPYEKNDHDEFNYSKHVHNDFLEITAESGILTGLLFIAVFIYSLIYTMKSWQLDIPEEIKIIGIFSFMSLSGYIIDAFFNFPAERSIMGMFLVFSLAIIIKVFTSNVSENNINGNKSLLKYSLLPFIFLLIIGSVYITYSTYRSMKVQWYTHDRFGDLNDNVTWQEVNSKFPAIPNLAENNVPIDAVKAWYLFKDHKFEEALLLLNRSKDVNPYSMVNEWLKSSVFYSMKMTDSAFYYANEGFFNRPRNLPLYQILNKISVERSDTATIKHSFREYNRYRDEPYAWDIYIKSLFAVDYNPAIVSKLADSLATLYPKDQAIQHTKLLIRSGNAYAKSDFSSAIRSLKEIIRLFPTDYESMENIGLSYFFMKDYTNAAIYFDKVVKSEMYNNGKSELYLGLSLSQTGKKDEGCRYLSIAVAKKFPNAEYYLKAHCK